MGSLPERKFATSETARSPGDVFGSCAVRPSPDHGIRSGLKGVAVGFGVVHRGFRYFHHCIVEALGVPPAMARAPQGLGAHLGPRVRAIRLRTGEPHADRLPRPAARTAQGITPRTPGPDAGAWGSVRRCSAGRWSAGSGGHRACRSAPPSSRSAGPSPGDRGCARATPPRPESRRAPPNGPRRARSERRLAAHRLVVDAFSSLVLAPAQHRRLPPTRQGRYPPADADQSWDPPRIRS